VGIRLTDGDSYTAAIVVPEVLLALEHLVALRERKVVEARHHGRDAHAVAHILNVREARIVILTCGVSEGAEDLQILTENPAGPGFTGGFPHPGFASSPHETLLQTETRSLQQ
jgi:hypothetical protein